MNIDESQMAPDPEFFKLVGAIEEKLYWTNRPFLDIYCYTLKNHFILIEKTKKFIKLINYYIFICKN